MPDRLFSFISMAYPGDTFSVISFDIQEGLCQLFRVELLLCSREKDIDFADILESPANCVLHAPDKTLPLHGVVSEFEQLHYVNELAFYRAVLSPRLWWLTLAEHNQVFLDKSVPQILEQVLKDGGLTTRDFLFKLREDYPARELVCQFNESHFDFFMRWIEREGMYFYFERYQEYTTLVVTDTAMAHPDLRRHKKIRYTPPSGMQDGSDKEVLLNLVCRRQPTPQSVRLKDFNYQTPHLDVSATQHVNEQGRGVSYHYGEHILNQSEGKRLARVRSEARKAAATRFHGESTVRSLRGGFIFTLTNHFRDDFNRDYLVVSCRHRGSQAAYLEAGLRGRLQGLVEEGPDYENTFTAIPADMQFRPLPLREKPRISGTLTATIDAAGSGQYAELDDQGRYKVILPFDLSGRKDGSASSWLRMMQPYGGAGHGLHCPLHKGTEVLLTFEAGDPDRPVIAGAVPNPMTPSPVTSAEQTMCKLTTSGGNKLHIEDKAGSQRFLLQTPTANTWLRLGAPNDPPSTTEDDEDGWHETEENTDGFRLVTEGDWYGAIGQHMEIEVGGNSTKIVVGGEETIIMGFDNKTVGGIKTEITVGDLAEFTLGGVLDVMVAGKVEVSTGVVIDINAALHTEIRPHCVELKEQSLHLHNAHTAIHDLKTKLGNVEDSLIDEKISLLRAKHDLIEHEDKLMDMEEQMVMTQRKIMLRTEQMIDDRMEVVEDDMAMLGNKMRMCEAEIKLMTESLEIAEKTFL
jgi:type VI secretion system secreted protein VgrG